MEDKDILEGNKLIALSPFACDEIKDNWTVANHNGALGSFYRVLKYHTSWDWLMPVVEKIEALGPYWIRIAESNCHVMKNTETLLDVDGKSKIEAVWQAAVQFIQYYNQSLNNSK